MFYLKSYQIRQEREEKRGRKRKRKGEGKQVSRRIKNGLRSSSKVVRLRNDRN
jgi:hypothetical protein